MSPLRFQLAAQVRAFLGEADLPLRTMSLPFHARSGASPPIGEGQEAGGGFIHRGEQRGGHRSGAACDAGIRLFLGLKSPIGLGFDASPGEATGGKCGPGRRQGKKGMDGGGWTLRWEIAAKPPSRSCMLGCPKPSGVSAMATEYMSGYLRTGMRSAKAGKPTGTRGCTQCCGTALQDIGGSYT